MIPITDTPKRIPITLSDTLTLSDTHYGHTPKKIPITLSDTLTLSDIDTLSDFSSH